LFICRNAGNIIPPHSNQTGGVTASIEFAVAALGVSHIVICGHVDCGAMKGALHPELLDGLPHVKEWLSHCRSAIEVVKEKQGALTVDSLDEVTKENVLQQLQHLRTHPAVAAKLATKQIQLHGWVYNIEKGSILCYEPSAEAFIEMEQAYAEQILA
ncbi:MAG: carbonic anhydrase, partial [Gammaproteobacteria bacterium]